ncbi:LuxR C-terminal-related transcriptional regulator [Kordiimonas sp. SCSIO 12610]|uniref:LuxR C-terminal-related transcriptional regulator n=1 Tax=Kordiimonas sp. SCSIO 12610 TaxID=2829597 RepID=UPI00210C6BEC|nr:LuxR C-terminal-related transcriptional regulator [Kordiimonas sp. SCSIO 12610]UTW54433.1 autoinducer binding domain-containing protein [Kordiimonas sp. SCSIO 12610]
MLQIEDKHTRESAAFCDAALLAASISELEVKFTDLIRSLGFDDYICTSCMAWAEEKRVRVHSASLAVEALHEYIIADSRYNNPILRKAASQIYPFDWSEAEFLAGLNEMDQSFLSIMDEQGILEGYTIPLHYAGFPVSALTLISSQSTIPSILTWGMKYMISFVVSAFFEAYVRLSGTDQAGENDNSSLIVKKLTPRERECLYWVSKGKTDAETASILNLAESTVHAHVESAKKRMGVHTRIQAVMRAYFLNQIHA